MFKKRGDVLHPCLRPLLIENAFVTVFSTFACDYVVSYTSLTARIILKGDSSSTLNSLVKGTLSYPFLRRTNAQCVSLWFNLTFSLRWSKSHPDFFVEAILSVFLNTLFLPGLCCLWFLLYISSCLVPDIFF